MVKKWLFMHWGFVFGLIIISALVAFEIFNYSTTDFALRDLLGDLSFFKWRWSVILAIAFCGIDFAGIARLFTPETGEDEPQEIWYLFGAWLVAATMNAMLTWWAVSLALLQHESLGSAIVSREQLLKVVPIFLAVMVWLIRVLIIGTFSVAGDRLFSQGERRVRTRVGFPSTFKPQYQPARAAQTSRATVAEETGSRRSWRDSLPKIGHRVKQEIVPTGQEPPADGKN